MHSRGSNMTILIISDDKEIYNITEKCVCKSIKINGFPFSECENIEIENYNLIILDYNRQYVALGNFELIFEIRCKSEVPILAILEESTIRDKLQILKMKADDYIEKPLNIFEYKEKVEKLLL